MHKKSLYGVLISTTAALSGFTATPAHAYDMDCKVILCIAGGFPSGCHDAYSYMISRITRFPHPLPPFGICTSLDENNLQFDYSNVKSNYSYLNDETAEGWHCPKQSKLYFNISYGDNGKKNITAFCYQSAKTVRVGTNRDSYLTTQYVGRTAANPVNFQMQITVEPNTSNAFKSPFYKLNYNTGYISHPVSWQVENETN